MPPKFKINKADIIKAAVEIVRAKGAQSVNARVLAAALNCSTQPIFSNFASMKELHEAVAEEAYGIYLDFLNREAESGEYPKYKAFGMAYIRFAKEEKELFKLLFMCDREGREAVMTPDFDASTEIIMETNGVTRETAALMHLEMWTCVHGIGAMVATSFLSFEWETISMILSDVYHGIRERHCMGER